jgi:hypothetical protein
MHAVASRRTLFGGGLLVLLGASLAVALLWPSSSNSTPNTVPLHGKMLNIANFFAPACPSVTGVCSSFTAIGSIQGEGVVEIDTPPNPTGRFPRAISDAHTVITTKKGELHCTETAIFDVQGADHAFVDLCLITGGTGIYDGASGYIQEVGTFDFAANRGELDYYGELVYASS